MNEAKKPAILVDGLTKHFGEFVAVDHVSFSVEEGEIFGWLGPNGAGKTACCWDCSHRLQARCLCLDMIQLWMRK